MKKLVLIMAVIFSIGLISCDKHAIKSAKPLDSIADTLPVDTTIVDSVIAVDSVK